MRITILLVLLLCSSGCDNQNSKISLESDFVILSSNSDHADAKALDKNVIRDQILLPNKRKSDEDITDAECTISAAQQELLDAHNTARSIGRNCGTDFYPATTPLNWDCTLAEISDDHNQDMANNNFFNHTGSDGLRSSDRATNAGYIWQTVGENIAAGQQSVNEVMNDWLDSPGHCANIMRPAYKDIGSDVYNAFGSQYPTYWTAVFGTRRSF